MDIEDKGYKKLKASDKELFDGYYTGLKDYWASTLCFASMIAWSTSITIYYKEINGFLVCIEYDYVYKRYGIIPFIGHYTYEGVANTLMTVREDLKELEIPLAILDVSEWMMDYYRKVPGIKWKEINDRGLMDYIYSMEDFKKSLETSEARYNYRYFIRKNAPYVQEITGEMSDEEKEECVNFLKSVWCEYHGCEECHYGCMIDTLRNILEYFDEVAAHGIIVRVEGKIVGYSIVTYRREMAVYQFMKNIRSYRGLKEFLHKECLERYISHCKIINYTEDMDREGIRAYKMKLAPYILAPKYELQEIL